MKLYIRGTVSIENLKAQYGKKIPDDLFEELVRLDPTADFDTNKGGKYCPWIFRQYNKKDLKQSDFTNIADALMMFSRDYKKFPKPNIMDYQTVGEFIEDSHDVGNRELTDKEKKKLLKRHAHNAGDADKEFIVEDGEWEVWKPLTYAGSISLARTGGNKASWCTAYEGNDNYWRSYTSKGPLYIFLNKNNPREKYQLHIPTNSWYDINDHSMGMSRFWDFCADHPAVAEYFKVRSEGGVQTCADTIVGFDKNATELIIPEGVTAIPGFEIPSKCTRVVLPSTITEIAPSTFQNSAVQALEFVHLDSIGRGAFENSQIRDIDFSKIDVIGDNAFAGCKNLTSLANVNPEGNFGAYAFYGDTGITGTVDIVPTMHLHTGSFDGCPNLILVWKAGDIGENTYYDINDIKALIVDEKICPNLVACNIDPATGEPYIPIRAKL